MLRRQEFPSKDRERKQPDGSARVLAFLAITIQERCTGNREHASVSGSCHPCCNPMRQGIAARRYSRPVHSRTRKRRAPPRSQCLPVSV